MGLTKNQFNTIRKELEESKKPLFFFHDDPDGVCSFLLFYNHIKEGYGVIVKARPIIDMKFMKKVEQYSPDKIFVLDIAMMEQEFVDDAKRKIVWVDHHPPQEIHDVQYFNPRISKPLDNECVSYLCYQTVKKKLWVAMVGIIGDMDWHDELVSEFREQYPGLLPDDVTEPRKATYETELGKLVRIFSFVLKGTSTDAMKYIKALTRIEEPSEILNQENPRGRFIYKRYKKIDDEYQKLIREAETHVSDDKILLFIYQDKMAFSGDLANEMAYRHPDKIIIMGREKEGNIMCSFRTEKYNLPKMIEKALVGCEGYGGGHEHAAGGCIKADDLKNFVDNLRRLD